MDLGLRLYKRAKNNRYLAAILYPVIERRVFDQIFMRVGLYCYADEWTSPIATFSRKNAMHGRTAVAADANG
jgi:hypothetical protein